MPSTRGRGHSSRSVQRNTKVQEAFGIVFNGLNIADNNGALVAIDDGGYLDNADVRAS